MRVNVLISAAACDTPALSLMDIEGDPFILVVHFLVLLLHLCVTLQLTHRPINSIKYETEIRLFETGTIITRR